MYNEFSSSVQQIKRKFNIAKLELNNIVKQICEILIWKWQELKDESINEQKSSKSNERIKQINTIVKSQKESKPINLKDIAKIEWENSRGEDKKEDEEDYHQETQPIDIEPASTFINNIDEKNSISIDKKHNEYIEENWSKEQWVRKNSLLQKENNPTELEENNLITYVETNENDNKKLDFLILEETLQELNKMTNNINILFQTEKNRSRVKVKIKSKLRKHKYPENTIEQKTQKIIDMIENIFKQQP